MSLGLRPFFTYYGGKWRAAPRYPVPTYGDLIEPFAGSAGYALRYYEHRVVLVEKDPRIAALWQYLIRVTPSEIAALPSEVPETVDTLPICEEARWLIGFWLNKGAAQPCKMPSAWMRSGVRPKSYWGPEVRAILAAQAGRITHWKVIEGDYTKAPERFATWFIDPPYLGSAGRLYKHGAKDIDYAALSRWCLSRSGQVLVCENEGAAWLPFEPFGVMKSTPGSRGKGYSREVLWHRCYPSDDGPRYHVESVPFGAP